MRYTKYEVALLTIAQVNNNILQVCSNQEDKEFQLAKLQTTIYKLGQESFLHPITKTRWIATESLRLLVGDLFTNVDYTEKYGLK